MVRSAAPSAGMAATQHNTLGESQWTNREREREIERERERESPMKHRQVDRLMVGDKNRCMESLF